MLAYQLSVTDYCSLKQCSGHLPSLNGKSYFLASQVSSTTSHHVALTAKGELLTWAFTKEKAVRENKGFAATALEPLSLMDRSRGVHVWRPRTQGGVDSVAGAGDSAGFAEFGHVDSACVWQVLYDRPRVKDVACGGEHTLAVLETGQVRDACCIMCC